MTTTFESLAPGQVGGLITDPTGAVVPGVTVEVLHRDSGVTRKALTDGSGRWLLADIPAGRLRITASVPSHLRVAR